MAGASESILKTTSVCTAACIAQAFLGLAAKIGLGSILASDLIYIGQSDNAIGLACWDVV